MNSIPDFDMWACIYKRFYHGWTRIKNHKQQAILRGLLQKEIKSCAGGEVFSIALPWLGGADEDVQELQSSASVFAEVVGDVIQNTPTG